MIDPCSTYDKFSYSVFGFVIGIIFTLFTGALFCLTKLGSTVTDEEKKKLGI